MKLKIVECGPVCADFLVLLRFVVSFTKFTEHVRTNYRYDASHLFSCSILFVRMMLDFFVTMLAFSVMGAIVRSTWDYCTVRTVQ